MIQKDYILRLIEQIAYIIARIFNLKLQGQYHVALNLIDQTYRDYFGLNSQFLNSFSLEDLLTVLRSGGMFDPGKGIVMADLLKAEGDVYFAQGDRKIAVERFVRALTLYLEVYRDSGSEILQPRQSKIAELIADLQDFLLPRSLLERLFHYYRGEHHYGKARDALNDLCELEPDADIITLGLNFYGDLNRLTDAQIERGGLTRAVVKEGQLAYARLKTERVVGKKHIKRRERDELEKF